MNSSKANFPAFCTARRLAPLLLASALLPAAAHAQQAPATDEIVVTARRGNEQLRDVPASITVLSEDVIRRAQVRNVQDVVTLTSGVSIVTGTAEVGDTQINIRGVNGARDAEGSVALVVDGILKTNTAALNQAQSDLTQIEILKGPQGAIYGRNAAAGAIVISTRKPGDRLELRARASAANNNRYEASTTLSGPIGDTAGFVLNGEYFHTDGFYRNTGPNPAAQGPTVDQQESVFLNGRLLVEPSENLSLDFKGRYGRVTAGSIAYNVVFALPNVAAAFGAPAFAPDVNDQKFDFLSNIGSDGTQETVEFSGKADLDLGAVRLTGWALYSDIQQELIADGAVAAFGFFNSAPECRASTLALFNSGFALPPPLSIASTPEASTLGGFSPTTCDSTQYQVRNQSDFSAEVRLASNDGGALDWSVGGYFLSLRRQVGVAIGYDRGQGVLRNLFNPQGSSNPTEQLANDRFDTTVFAAFGSLEYDVSEQLTLSGALRYDRELRRVRNLVDPLARNQFLRGGNQPLNVGLDFGPLEPQREVFEQLQPRLSLAFKPSSDLTMFASWGVGFKSGGFNNQGSQATIEGAFNGPAIGADLAISDRFRKERSSAFEVGMRGAVLDGRLRFEAAGYLTDVTDMQFFEFFAGPFGILRVVSNIDKVRLQGLEGSLTARVIDGWTLQATGNLTDSTIKRNSARPGTEGGRSPYTPDYTLNFSSDMAFPVSDSVELLFRADYQRVGPTWFSTVQEGDRPTLFRLFFGPVLGTGNFSQARRDPYGILNLRAGARFSGVTVTAFATNVLKERYLAEVIPAPEFGGSFASPGALRTIGLELATRF